jgi:SAM-dependent methyltransferase
MTPEEFPEHVRATEDASFDLVYPERIRALSAVHWTPVQVARQAAAYLVDSPGTRVLDIGCGPGKFCIVGALATSGVFTGVEQRRRLCELGWEVIRRAGLRNAEIYYGNIRGLRFSDFDAFYLFNPFAEFLETTGRIDNVVGPSDSLYDDCVEFVAAQLAAAPAGTRVATYCGICEEIPPGYDCVGSAVNGKLRFWEKARPVSAT